ncbi:hypothetical protein CBW24_15540 (plasmid) [Pacificitalea manganoxidans]|uniref:Biopolymer transporter ExbD n=1 Tax=Pacificitalea manganoxidans TaxID=1411902 RepID=A0A291M3Q2_9RHOB|nr:biopolymer transporter ExbD [Pacificitalea manganoxidans]ATI43562.1 hypothetical protein CBW24_15540 [Pacificitalea manganoxidans]MBF52992.1 biopolymer transporter ExbD [Actibacterium sp.]MDR6310002.1 biopolymer transport protein ExbD [Pacificitalea manganoxidans]
MARIRKPRRRLSMTSLIDVIFLLLLFFMLTSTFSKFSEVELASAAGSAQAAPSQARPIFLQLDAEGLRINGRDHTLASLAEALAAPRFQPDAPEPGTAIPTDAADATPVPVIVSLGADVTAQRLTDLLVALRQIPGATPTILGDPA